MKMSDEPPCYFYLPRGATKQGNLILKMGKPWSAWFPAWLCRVEPFHRHETVMDSFYEQKYVSVFYEGPHSEAALLLQPAFPNCFDKPPSILSRKIVEVRSHADTISKNKNK